MGVGWGERASGERGGRVRVTKGLRPGGILAGSLGTPVCRACGQKFIDPRWVRYVYDIYIYRSKVFTQCSSQFLSVVVGSWGLICFLVGTYLELGDLLHFQGVSVSRVGQRALGSRFLLDRTGGGGLLRFGAFLGASGGSDRGGRGRGRDRGFRRRCGFRHGCGSLAVDGRGDMATISDKPDKIWVLVSSKKGF